MTIIIFGIYFLIFYRLNWIICCPGNFLSRRREFEADSYATSSALLNYGSSLCEGLVELDICNKALIDSDPMYSFIYHSHPQLMERIANDRKRFKKDKLTDTQNSIKNVYCMLENE